MGFFGEMTFKFFRHQTKFVFSFILSSVPQLPPLNVRSGDITGTTIELLFDNIADPFQNFGYPIASKINVTAVSDIFQQQEMQYGGPNSAIISGLNEYTNYSLSVAVGTRRGFLVFAQPILVRTDFGRESFFVHIFSCVLLIKFFYSTLCGINEK